MKTPLFDRHVRDGARLVDFNGWDLPLYYSGILAEHASVRQKAGIFDLCHMARFRISRGGFGSLDYAATGGICSMQPGRVRYMLMCGESGGIIDDVLVYRDEDFFRVVANAANREAAGGLLGRDGARDETLSTGMLAVQGPEAVNLTRKIFGEGPSTLRNYGFASFAFESGEVMISRTGYTGEDGFEFMCGAESAGRLWDALLSAGGPLGLKPSGLGARDLLRLEAGMPLYGNELDITVNPFEAGLDRFVCLAKNFRGREALLRLSAEQPSRVLTGVVSPGKAVPRRGCPLFRGKERAGEVTSGSYSPCLAKPVAMAYIKKEFSEPGTRLEVEIRNRREAAEVAELPFYRRGC